MRKSESRPVPIQQRLHALPGLDLLLDILDGPLLKDVPTREVGVLKLRLPTAHDMVEGLTEFLIGVRFRVVLVDPAREAGTDEFGVLDDDVPIGVVFDLGIDKGHLLRTGDALVSVQCSSC